MGETRVYYCTYSFQASFGNGVGRDTFTITGTPCLPERLSMTEIKKVEAGLLETARKKVPDATALFLTWWTEIAADPSPTDGGAP